MITDRDRKTRVSQDDRPTTAQIESRRIERVATEIEEFQHGHQARGLDLNPLLLLHRHSDGFVTFHSLTDRSFRDVNAVRGSALRKYFPFLGAELDEDGLVSINAFYKPKDKDGRTAEIGVPLRRTDALRYLCACYVDLDFYNVSRDYKEVFLTVLRLQEDGLIPHPSVISRSGRGMWLLWFLRDADDANQPTPATDEHLRMYIGIQAAINEWLAPLGADSGAKDPARTTRVPGSLHVEADRRVQWSLQGNGTGPYSYTLKELQTWFEVDVAAAAPRKRRGKNEESGPGREGWEALNNLRLNHFVALRSLRGGFREGCRNRAALIFAWVLKNDGHPESEIREHVESMGRECDPPLSIQECHGAVKSALRYTRMKNRTISDWLGITPEEVEQLKSEGHDRWNAATRFSPPAPETVVPQTTLEDRRIAVRKRRDFILETKRKNPTVPSTRAMQDLLSTAGFKVSHVTVLNDYRALKFRLPQHGTAPSKHRRHAQ